MENSGRNDEYVTIHGIKLFRKWVTDIYCKWCKRNVVSQHPDGNYQEVYCETCKPIIPVPQQTSVSSYTIWSNHDIPVKLEERELRRQEYCKQCNLSPEYQAKLNLYLEDRKKPPSERIYV